jgi:hypothetical protein
MSLTFELKMSCALYATRKCVAISEKKNSRLGSSGCLVSSGDVVAEIDRDAGRQHARVGVPQLVAGDGVKRKDLRQLDLERKVLDQPLGQDVVGQQPRVGSDKRHGSAPRFKWALVAAWRLALALAILPRLVGLPWHAVAPAVLLPLSAIVAALAMHNLLTVTLQFMGGLRVEQAPGEPSRQAAWSFAFGVAAFASVLRGVAYLTTLIVRNLGGEER